MKKFDVHIKISFPDWYMVEANSPEEAKEKVLEMFIEQGNTPNTALLDWVTESLAGAKHDGQLNCEVEEVIEV